MISLRAPYTFFNRYRRLVQRLVKSQKRFGEDRQILLGHRKASLGGIAACAESSRANTKPAGFFIGEGRENGGIAFAPRLPRPLERYAL
jgi:monoamine oxidase